MVEWSSLLSNNKTIVVAVAAASAAAVAIAFLLRRPKQNRLDYELVGEVSSLNCFPIKSCCGITNSVAFCTASGMRMANVMDRHMVIVRPDGSFITQRQISKMAGVSTSVEGQELVLRAENMPELRIPVQPKFDKSKVVPCRVWTRHLEAQDCGAEVSDWLSQYLQEEGLRLLVLVPELSKSPSPAPNATSKDKVAFPDKSPYHIATEESLTDLQSRLPPSAKGEITMKNFRPNIVIKGTSRAWDEDNWSSLKIGKNLTMRVLAPCDRCLLTTVNPETRERRADEEPLNTLRSFRMFPEVSKSPMFGIFTAINGENTIRVGDPVYALRK